MDNRELNRLKHIVELGNEALPADLAAAREANAAVKEANEKIKDFILNESDTKEVREVDKWRRAH
jgi:hypothetical protein